jgi:hypothetical protein
MSMNGRNFVLKKETAWEIKSERSITSNGKEDRGGKGRIKGKA